MTNDQTIDDQQYECHWYNAQLSSTSWKLLIITVCIIGVLSIGLTVNLAVNRNHIFTSIVVYAVFIILFSIMIYMYCARRKFAKTMRVVPVVYETV